MFFMAAMLLVSTFRENFAILRRSASQEKKTTKQFFCFWSQKKTANGNQTIIGKRNNDDGDTVLFITCMFCCCLSMLFCLMETILFVFFWESFCYLWSLPNMLLRQDEAASASWSPRHRTVSGVRRHLLVAPLLSQATSDGFWWMAIPDLEMTKTPLPLCKLMGWQGNMFFFVPLQICKLLAIPGRPFLTVDFDNKGYSIETLWNPVASNLNLALKSFCWRKVLQLSWSYQVQITVFQVPPKKKHTGSAFLLRPPR